MAAVNNNIAGLPDTKRALMDMLEESFYEDLFKYGIYRLKTKFSIKYDLNRGFRGLMLEDLISQLITSFFEGKRKWNKTRFPVFKDQFLSSYDSHLSNTVTKEFKKVVVTDPLEEDDSGKDDLKVQNELIDDVINILENLDCSTEEILLFEPYYIGKMKREDIAETLGISVSEVTNAKKRLDRKLPLLRNELKKIGYEG